MIYNKKIAAKKIVYKTKKGKVKNINPAITLLFSTDVQQEPSQIVKAYRLRYQIEFVYRDGKQFCGWLHCQARSENKLDFHANAALTAINLAKFAHYKQNDKNQKTWCILLQALNKKSIINNFVSMKTAF